MYRVRLSEQKVIIIQHVQMKTTLPVAHLTGRAWIPDGCYSIKSPVASERKCDVFVRSVGMFVGVRQCVPSAGTPEPMGQGGQLPPLPFLAGGQGGQRCPFPKI